MQCMDASARALQRRMGQREACGHRAEEFSRCGRRSSTDARACKPGRVQKKCIDAGKSRHLRNPGDPRETPRRSLCRFSPRKAGPLRYSRFVGRSAPGELFRTKNLELILALSVLRASRAWKPWARV